MKSSSILSIFLSLFLFFTIGCSNADKGEAKTESAKSTTNAAAANALPIQRVNEIIAKCSKAEYVLYDHGMTFETQGKQALAFFGFISDEKADESKCKKDKYDASVVFKDEEGDIQMGIEFNLFNGCERILLEVDGKKYMQKMNEKGMTFFGQILKMDPRKMGEAK